MPNQNDAEITGVYVSQKASPGVQDDAPNAPLGSPTPGTAFDVTLEMVAGEILNTEVYTLVVSCADLTSWTTQPGLVPAFPPTASTIGTAPWQLDGTYYTYAQSETVNVPAGGGGGQVYQYTASLITANGQVASIKQSDPFVLY